MIVDFLKPYGVFNAGETGQVHDSHLDQLLNAGIVAVHVAAPIPQPIPEQAEPEPETVASPPTSSVVVQTGPLKQFAGQPRRR